jgi:hypothetical protein
MAKKKLRKPVKRKKNDFDNMRGCVTFLAEICGIAGFLLAVYIFIREYL